MLLLCMSGQRHNQQHQHRFSLLTWVSRRWQRVSMNRASSTMWAASKVPVGTTNSSTKSDQNGTDARRSRAATSISRKASHLMSHKLVESTVVVGDLSQRQMATRQHQDRNKHLNRAVYNEWGLYTFLMMLTYKCQLYGKELVFLDERNTTKMCSGCGHLQAMPLWKRTYCCTECGLVMDRDDNSAVNILTRYFARLGAHTERISVRCADVFTAIEPV